MPSELAIKEAKFHMIQDIDDSNNQNLHNRN